jgi:hypothetical protein
VAVGASQATTADGPPCRNPFETEQTRGRRGADGPRAAAPVHAGWRRGVRGREWECWEATCEERGARRQAGSTAEDILPYRHNCSREQQPGEGTGFPYLLPCRWTSYIAPRHGCQGQPAAPRGGDPRRSRRLGRARGRAGAPAGRRQPGRLALRRTRITKTDTAGEVSFAGISTLTHPVFSLVPNVHRAYFRLRQQ